MEELSIKDLLKTYKTITYIMQANGFTQDTSFRRVQTWLSNEICNSLEEKDIK